MPLRIPSEATFKRQFHETGFWSEDYGRFLIVNTADEMVGSIWFFKSIPYFDGLEIGYTMFDPQQRRQGIMTEALSLCVDYLFQYFGQDLGCLIGNDAIVTKCFVIRAGFL